MDAFEEIISGLFRAEGYWTYQNYKVILTADEKKAAESPTMPNPVIDILAYKPLVNKLIWIECKSYLDSGGVLAQSFTKTDGVGAERYKVFTREKYRKAVSEKLLFQTEKSGLTLSNPLLNYCLVAGNFYSDESEQQVKDHFEKQRDWMVIGPTEIRDSILRYADPNYGYENNVAVMVAKLIGRM